MNKINQLTVGNRCLKQDSIIKNQEQDHLEHKEITENKILRRQTCGNHDGEQKEINNLGINNDYQYVASKKQFIK